MGGVGGEWLPLNKMAIRIMNDWNNVGFGRPLVVTILTYVLEKFYQNQTFYRD